MDEAGRAAMNRVLERYYAEAVAIRSEGLALGKAGAKMAGHAVSTVLTSLVQGDPESIDSKIETEAAVLESRALKLCEHAMALQVTQVALAEAVPAFKPFPVTTRIDANDCR